ncbi:MAG: ATP-binding protein [Humidesulfovibrio sp.]|nr:ATP-binding protein [Humidesulfovibrio sp.]
MSSLRLPASEDSLSALRQLALDAAKHAKLDQAILQRVELVLEEALMNIVRHAYPPDAPERLVALDCEAGEGTLRLNITDWGAPFDPVAPANHRQEATLEANLEADLEHRAPGGLGLFFIRSMAQASYARQGGANVLTLRFSTQAAAS